MNIYKKVYLEPMKTMNIDSVIDSMNKILRLLNLKKYNVKMKVNI